MLNDGWKSSIHIHDILKTIFTIFENPQASCDAAIDELATLKFWTDRAAADAEIMKYVSFDNVLCMFIGKILIYLRSRNLHRVQEPSGRRKWSQWYEKALVFNLNGKQ